MSNIAQTVNVLQCLIETDGDDAWARPTYRVFDLYAPHKGNESVRTSLEAPTRDVGEDELPLVGASASVDENGTEVFLTLTNLDCRAAHTVDIGFEGINPEQASIDAEILFAGQAPETEVDAGNAGSFAAEELDIAIDGDGLSTDLEPATVAGMKIQ